MVLSRESSLWICFVLIGLKHQHPQAGDQLPCKMVMGKKHTFASLIKRTMHLLFFYTALAITIKLTVLGQTIGTEDPNRILLAGIFDTTTYDWGPDIFDLTVQLINEGWWNVRGDPDPRFIAYELLNSNCDETEAARAYWSIRTKNGNQPPHGIVGARCSGASTTLTRISGLEHVPQISPASNSARLSNDEEFPYFSRLVAPNDSRGEVGALIAMLRAFNWGRVTMLVTDTVFSQDFATAFKKSWNGEHTADSNAWTGTVAHFDTIRLTADGQVDEDSVQQVLEGVPSGDARVIVLVAHSQHAFRILKSAANRNFQPESIFVGPSTWAGRYDAKMNYDWLTPIPGYLGVAPLQNRDDTYQKFLAEFQAYQTAKRREIILEELPAFAAETVDAIVAMSKALLSTEDRNDGAAVVENLRKLNFNGVSGLVQFTTLGDRKNPQYTIFNAGTQYNGDEEVNWTEVGRVGVAADSAYLPNGIKGICFPGFPDELRGCRRDKAPSDKYPIPRERLPIWLVVVVVTLIVALLFVTYRYIRSKRKKTQIKEQLKNFQKSIVGMRAASCNYIPKIRTSREYGDIEQGGAPPEAAVLNQVTWCWKETDGYMDKHSIDTIAGNPIDCWIKYDQQANAKLETAFQGNKASCSPLAGYVVDFGKMTQTKDSTGFVREVQRLVENVVADDKKEILNEAKVETGEEIPEELAGEPQLVLVEGDIVQVSAHRPDGWAFGSKLYNSDENICHQLVILASGEVDGVVDGDLAVATDTGWFQSEHTRVPSTADLTVLQDRVGNAAGALNPPSYWAPFQNQDRSVVEQHLLPEGDSERDDVVKAFKTTLPRSRIVKVERVQNLALWQSYVVKRQTICQREMGADSSVKEEAALQKAVQRYEKRWLWHGSNTEVMEKILQQGFNRSFCGKNATAYGKGVYYARDSSYSADPTYAVPDRGGLQYIMACRVVVGEYCRGHHDALTPDVRDHKTHMLYDSTVNNVGNPSLYVTYHDAQSYPEYLITFSKK